MASRYAIAGHQGRYPDPTIRRIGTPDVVDVPAKGVADCNETPSRLIFLTLVYPPGTPFLARSTFPMPLRGLTVALGLLVGSGPPLVGLCAVLPVPGHATRHPYRRVEAG